MILCLGATPAVQRVMRFRRLTVDAVNRATDVTEASAGKSVNVAKVARALGADVLALGFLGGNTARIVRADCERHGVRHAFLDVAPKTRTCVTVVDESAGTTTELVQEAAPVEPADYDRLLAALDVHLPRSRVLVLSGTLTPGAPDDFYERCVTRASDAGVMSIVDARGEPLALALRARPTLAKPNLAELAQTVAGGAPLGSDDAIAEAVRRLCRAGASSTLITRGAGPAIASDGERLWSVSVPPVKAVNPIGSGDAVAAGLAVAMGRGERMPDACRLGIACGAANAMTPLAGEVHPRDVEALMPQVRIGPLR